MPHADREHELQISLATALRELDEARTDAAYLRFVNDKARESLAAANAKADAAEVELRVSGAAYGSLQDALATARRECEGLRKALGVSATWPVADVLARLTEGAEHFLGVHDCDCHRWESLQACVPLARSYVYAIRAALAAPAPAPGEET